MEKISRASLTIIDFECFFVSNEYAESLEKAPQHHYSSTLVMSEINDPEKPDLPLGCLWAPAYDGREGITFEKEADHIVSVFRQCFGEDTDCRDKFVNAVAVLSVKQLFEKNFCKWDPMFPSTDAAIQRACAWGVIAAKSREIEYRLFAASLACFLNFEIQNAFAYKDSAGAISVRTNLNDLRHTLVPVMKVSEVEVGKYITVLSAYS